MAGLLETRNRNVVPRWRDFRTTADLGELGSLRRNERKGQPVDLSHLVRDWEANSGLAVAGDLISAAVVNNVPEIARNAAEFVLEAGSNASNSLRSLANYVLSGTQQNLILSPSADPLITSPEASRIPSPVIAGIRRELGARPSNAILWVDLAYLYAVRGLWQKAERAIRTALQLAPANRFVLRSASRFLVHQDRVDEAHALIRRAPGVRTDPWLLSAEIALSMSARISPFFAKEGLSVLTSSNFATHHTSELSSAIGTLEASHGNTRKAKKHLNQSLISPTDNSLAQATWLAQNAGINLEISDREYEIARPFEANMYRAFIETQWEESLVASLKWVKDQPFSSRAARSAAYIANSIFLDHELSERIIKFGQIANPNDPGFFVGLAYGYARRNRLDEATAELKKIASSEAEDWIPTALDANHGLISYRRGDIVQGRALYEQAAEKAEKLDEKRVKVSALTNWAMEEIGNSKKLTLRLIQDAIDTGKRTKSPEVPFLIATVIEKLKTFEVEGTQWKEE